MNIVMITYNYSYKKTLMCALMRYLRSSYYHLLLSISHFPYLRILTFVLLFGSERPSAHNLNILRSSCFKLEDNLYMPLRRMSQRLHPHEAPPQEPINPPPPNQSSPPSSKIWNTQPAKTSLKCTFTSQSTPPPPQQSQATPTTPLPQANPL
jgi:hypothetical protein